MAHGVWVLIESSNGAILPITKETLSKGREFAEGLGQTLCGVLLGHNIDTLSQQTLAYGAEKVYAIDDPALEHYTTDAFVAAAKALIEKYQPEVLLTGSSLQMRDFTSALAAELHTGLAPDCTGAMVDNGVVKAVRPSHGSNVINTLTFGAARPMMISLRRQVAPPAEAQEGRSGEVIKEAMPQTQLRQKVQKVAERTGAVNLADATIIVSGGRGLGSPENYERLIPALAQVMGGTYGASRAIVDAGWVPYERQVGQTGKTVSPKLYVACGISGAIQHLAGMRNSGTIVAINKDPEAPIFKVATYGVIGDVNDILPQLTDEVKRRTGRS